MLALYPSRPLYYSEMTAFTYPDWVKESVLEMYMQGKGNLRIEALTGVHRATVSRWCRDAGISRSFSEASQIYPDWIKEPILEMYSQGLGSTEIELLTGISHETIRNWCRDAGISRSISEAKKGRVTGAESHRWKGDKAGYEAQHRRAIIDYPLPLGLCELCGEKEALDRARIDHTTLPYDPELVVLACKSCNKKHDDGTISITFLHDGRLLCAIKEDRKPRLQEVV
jgi:transposase-like protein